MDDRIHVLHEQLEEEFPQAVIAETGSRIMEAIPARSGDGIGRYEYALALTLLALRARRDGHPPAEWNGGISLTLRHMRRELVEHVDPMGVAAGAVYACMGCHFVSSLTGSLNFEPVA